MGLPSPKEEATALRRAVSTIMIPDIFIKFLLLVIKHTVCLIVIVMLLTMLLLLLRVRFNIH
jgi:hypothetical protein